jgi:type III secretion protein Q
MPRDDKSIAPLHSRLPALTPALARLTRVLFTRAADQLAARRACRIVPLDAGGTLARPGCLHLQGAHGGLRCLIDLHDHPALESAALVPADDERAALADALLQPCRDALAQLGLPALSATALLADADMPRAGVALQLCLDADVAATLIVTDIDPGLLDALEAALSPGGLPGWLGTLPLPGAAVLAARRCTPALLASLRDGDVLLGWRAGVAGRDRLDRVILRWGATRGRHFSAAAAIDGSAVTLATSPNLCQESPHMDQMDHMDHPATDVAALELPVTLEIVTLAMPLQQIGTLQPGHVLELPLALADARVRLVACGQTLGHGKLVVVGEQLGFQVSTMVNQHEPDA